MTDKQIIIDGIDVSGCGYIDRDSAWCDLCMTNCVKETKPCYYKQLIRKEQECERLKKEVEFYTTPVKLGDYKPITLIIEELDQLKADNKHLNDLLNQALKELEQSREAIEKIKERAKAKIEWCKDNKKICLNCAVICSEIQILQICDEVNDER